MLAEVVNCLLNGFREQMAICSASLLSDSALDISQDCWVFPVGTCFQMFVKLETKGYEKLKVLCCRCQGVKFPGIDLRAITSYVALPERKMMCCSVAFCVYCSF